MTTKETQQLNRRNVLKRSAIAAAGVPVFLSEMAKAATPPQTEGPFHPVNLDQDLTRQSADSPIAEGEVVVVTGTVRDEVTRATLPNVIVELWQADANGLYNHPADPRAGSRDRNFQFWGRAVTDSQGRFDFRTVKPGAYPASADGSWWRPPHLHWRFLKRGYLDLTTQSYFTEEARLNEADLILRRLTQEGRDNVILSFTDQGGIRRAHFNVDLVPA